MKEPPIELTVAEYSSLRAEILQAQHAMLLMLGLIITLVSAISGVVLTNATKQVETATGLTPGLMGFALLIVAVGLRFNAVLTQQKDTLSGYIRQHVEKRHGGAMWETVWTEHRLWLAEQGASRSKLPLGQSKAYALIYSALIGGLVVEYFIAEQHGSLQRALVVVAPAAIGLWLAADLYLRRGSRWENPFASSPSGDS